MNSEECDDLIVGAGPAGLAAAVELLEAGVQRVILLEKGEAIQRRYCQALESGRCCDCYRCAVLSGVGGASGILGGQLCFFPAGECLARHSGFAAVEANAKLLAFFERTGLRSALHLSRSVTPASSLARTGGLTLKPYLAVPLLRPALQVLFHRLVHRVLELGGTIWTRTEAIDITPGFGNCRFIVRCNRQGASESITVRHSVVLATGRSGSQWLTDLLARLGIAACPDAVDVGVRLETVSQCINEIQAELRDPKYKIHENTASEVRTLCWCRGGQLLAATAEGVCVVDGQYGDDWSPLTSVSVVTRMPVPEGCSPMSHALDQFRDLTAYHHPLHQELSQFLGGRAKSFGGGSYLQSSRSTMSSQEADLRSAIAKPVIAGVTEMLEELDHLVNGRLFASLGTRVYAPVIDRFWNKPDLDNCLMTPIPDLYVAGDATALGRGILQSLFSGIVVAQAITGSGLGARLVPSPAVALA